MTKFRVGLLVVVLIFMSSAVAIAAQTAVRDGVPYTIQAEDTLWDISRAHGLTLDDLLDANPGLDPYALPIGEVIIIPSLRNLSGVTALKPATPEPTPEPSTGTIEYALQEGETLWGLTYRFNVSFEELLAANPNVDVYAMQIGAIVRIPGQPLAAEPAAEVDAAELPETLQMLDIPSLRDGLNALDIPVIDEGLDPTPAPFIEPRINEFAGIGAPEPDNLPEDSLLAEGSLLAVDEPVVVEEVVPAALDGFIFPITITADDAKSIAFAQLSINDTTVATFDEPPFTYEIDVTQLGIGLYTLTFVTENAGGVLSSSSFDFEVAPLPLPVDAKPSANDADTRLGIFVNGVQQDLNLSYSVANGLHVVEPVLEVVREETLSDILARPANLIPADVRAAITMPRPELFSLVILVMTLTLLPQGLFTLFYMMYTWNNPEIAEQYRSPKEYFTPQFSFTAILPARREENVIYDTIRAVDAIDYPDHLKEILIMIRDDDDDDTIAAAHRAARDIGKDHIHVITFTDGPKNKPNGLNRGLRASTKDVVCVFDAEDQPHPEIYNVINTVMLRDQADVVQSGVQLMNFKSTWFSALNCLEYFFWFKSGLHAFTRMFGVTPLGGNTVFFKRQWLEKVRGWDEACLTEDADIGLRLTQAGAKIQIVYDETHATQEETPDSVDQFIKQRTRWNQGFYQVFFKGDWARMPSMKQKITALYILLNSLFQALIVLYLPLGLYIMLTQSLPVPIALISWIPIFMLITQLIVNLIGLGEFTRAYGEHMPFLFRFKTALVYYPYQLLLSLSAARAIWRLVTNRSSWEKTAHSNLHRQSSAPVAQGTV